MKQSEIELKLDSLKALFESEVELWNEYEAMNSTLFLNEKIMNFFADSLHLVNQDDILEKYQLEDIQKFMNCL
ncbi:hypothetical protein [Mucilaginibacter antarcticus]|uniref:hypothetical protein n=1 Tax=Mucilaginibacter antarcticus TaxID=1855725 RepID=UPI00363B2031